MEDSEYINLPVHVPTNNQKQEHQQRNFILISIAHAQSTGKKRRGGGSSEQKISAYTSIRINSKHLCTTIAAYCAEEACVVVGEMH